VFESATQHFFYVRDKFPQRVLAAPLSARAGGVESEQTLSLFNEV